PLKGTDYFDGKNGINGTNGITPIKGTDYFDGKNGINGTNGITPIKGTDYFDGVDGKNGLDGTGSGDMAKSVYDPDNDGKINYNDLVNKPILLQGEKGNDGTSITGAKGDSGFSPTVTVATNTATEYTLSIVDAVGTTTTPNLKGADATSGGSTSIGGSDDYTLDKEIEVGVWFSGEKLYRKVVLVPNVTVGAFKVTSASLAGTGNIIKSIIGGMGCTDYSQWFPVPHYSGAGSIEPFLTDYSSNVMINNSIAVANGKKWVAIYLFVLYIRRPV
ncbi:hypothetical protein, partial [Clostridium estertheticum]